MFMKCHQYINRYPLMSMEIFAKLCDNTVRLPFLSPSKTQNKIIVSCSSFFIS